MKKLNDLTVALVGANIQWIALVAVMAFSLAMQISCSKVNSAKIINGFEKAVDVATLVCNTAPLFSDNLAKPLERCDDMLKTAAKLKNDKRVQAIVSVSVCAEEYSKTKNKIGLVECVDAVDGAKLIIAEIEK